MLINSKMLGCVLTVAVGFSFAAEAKKPPPDPDMIAARTKIFGIENVDQKNGNIDKEKVIISWISNASYAVAAKGHVMLLDTFVTRLEITPGRTPIVIADLVNLQPDALLLGHGHFDHADNAAYIAALTGATIYASPETCDNMAIDAANNSTNGYTPSGSTVTCFSPTHRASIPGSEVVEVKHFEPDISLTVFTHLHSNASGLNDPNAVPIAATQGGVCRPTRLGNTFPCNLQDPRDPLLFPAGTSLTCPSTGTKPEGCKNIATSRQGNGGPISLFYVFTVHGPNNFRFVWHNSTGDIVDSCALPNNLAGTQTPYLAGQEASGCFLPNKVTVNGKTVGANLADIMDSLRPVDVQLGSVVSLGFSQNGERDIVSYIAHVQPKVFIPGHVTAVAVEGSSLEWKVAYFDALRAPSTFPPGSTNNLGATYVQLPQANWPEALWTVDPNDYIRPMVFTPSDARWKKEPKNP